MNLNDVELLLLKKADGHIGHGRSHVDDFHLSHRFIVLFPQKFSELKLLKSGWIHMMGPHVNLYLLFMTEAFGAEKYITDILCWGGWSKKAF